jgi:hypothetical protein
MRKVKIDPCRKTLLLLKWDTPKTKLLTISEWLRIKQMCHRAGKFTASERIYGIRNSGDRVSESRTTNGLSGQKTQSDLAEDLGIDKKTLQRAKKLAELPEDIQQMVMDGKVTASINIRIRALWKIYHNPQQQNQRCHGH